MPQSLHFLDTEPDGLWFSSLYQNLNSEDIKMIGCARSIALKA